MYDSIIPTLIQSASDSGRVSRMSRMLTPVNNNEHGPGPVGSAAQRGDIITHW